MIFRAVQFDLFMLEVAMDVVAELRLRKRNRPARTGSKGPKRTDDSEERKHEWVRDNGNGHRPEARCPPIPLTGFLGHCPTFERAMYQPGQARTGSSHTQYYRGAKKGLSIPQASATSVASENVTTKTDHTTYTARRTYWTQTYTQNYTQNYTPNVI